MTTLHGHDVKQVAKHVVNKKIKITLLCPYVVSHTAISSAVGWWLLYLLLDSCDCGSSIAGDCRFQ
jgi:hypothetical protein